MWLQLDSYNQMSYKNQAHVFIYGERPLSGSWGGDVMILFYSTMPAVDQNIKKFVLRFDCPLYVSVVKCKAQAHLNSKLHSFLLGF